MHLLIITREWPGHVLGGISYHLNNLYTGVVNKGHEITVITGVCPQSEPDLADEAPEVVDIHRVQFGYRKGYYVLFPLALKNFLRSFDFTGFDACITHSEVPFELPIPVISKRHDCYQETKEYIRSGLAVHELIADRAMDPLRKIVDQHSLRKADHLIFNSELCREGWERHYDFSTPSSISYNGVNTGDFYPDSGTSTPTEDYLLFVGNSERKGLSRVIDFAEGTKEHIVAVGPSTIDSPHVSAVGRVNPDKLRVLYTGADATIHPTSFEAFGNVILESVACGTPVVTTNQCGAAEVLDPSCCVITDDLVKGVRRARQLDREDCIQAAKAQPWSSAVKDLINSVHSVIRC